MTYVRKERIIFLLMVSPALFLLAIFFIWPLFSSFWISFHTWPMFGKPKWVGLDNYIYTLNDPRFWERQQNEKKEKSLLVVADPLQFLEFLGI